MPRERGTLADLKLDSEFKLLPGRLLATGYSFVKVSVKWECCLLFIRFLYTCVCVYCLRGMSITMMKEE